MSRLRAPRLAVERSMAVVARNLFREQSELLTVGRFELIRTVGAGGMGVVYEAFDPLRGEPVALKMLNGRGASELYRLKREFRSLTELSHPNLVALHELNISREHACFTMELIRGTDIVTHIHDSSAPYPQLQEILLQLCRGIRALHAAGKLHRDLKPSNVLVSDSGRVVLLDFGLVQDTYQDDAEVEGTPAFMAPEQQRGEACEASDWYSFGRILARILSVTASGAPSPGASAASELSGLVEALLQPQPERRPSADQITAIVSGAASAPRTQAGTPPRALFVGRARELQLLTGALARSRGRPVLALIRGEAGVGKTALMRHFVRGTLGNPRALVLTGRCYENEFLPFKAFDSAIDELSRHLMACPESRLAGLNAQDRRALLQLFPVLARVPKLAAQGPAAEELHPVEARRRGFLALKELFRLLATQGPLILCIDDIQWSDSDSGALLAALLCDPDGPPLLVIGSDRSDPGLLNPALEELYRAADLALEPVEIVELALAAFSEREALTLARSLLPEEAGSGAARLARLAHESRGNPLFLGELLRWATSSRARSGPGADPHPASMTIDSIVAARMQALSSEARQALELIALAGRPVSTRVVEHALQHGKPALQLLEELRRARLVHLVRRAEEELLEIEHDRIGEAILRRVDAARRHELHAHLAGALAAEDGPQSDSSIAQYIAAQLPEEAARRARRAGQLALSALAFSRAAWLFEQALALGRWPEAARAHLYAELAVALEHSGRALEAANAYRSAAQHTKDCFDATLLEAAAAEHLIHNGRYAEGLDTIRRCYASLGLTWPRTNLGVAVQVLKLLVSLHFGHGKAHTAEEPSRLHLARARVLSAVGVGLETSDVLRTLHNALLVLRETAHSPDAGWRVRALCLRGGLRSSWPCGGTTQALRTMEEAAAAALKLGDLSIRTDVLRQLATVQFLDGNVRAALGSIIACEADLRILPLPPREMYRVAAISGSVLWELGEFREVRRRWGALAHEARDRSDALTSCWVHAHPAQFGLCVASDDRTGAEALLERQAQFCARYPEFRPLRWAHAACRSQAELRWGSAAAALEVVERDWPALSQTGYPFFTAWSLLQRARSMFAVAALLAPGRERARLLRRTRAIMRSLRWQYRERSTVAALCLLEVCQALLEQKPALALALLERTLPQLDAQHRKVTAATARYAQSLLQPGDVASATRATASAVLTSEGIVDPHAWCLWTLPAFRGLEAPC